MKHAAAAKTTHSVSGKAPFTVGIIGLTFLDTTWRIVTPVLLFTILGIVADLKLGTKPWLTLIIGVPVGFFLAFLLVKRQLQAIERDEERKQ